MANGKVGGLAMDLVSVATEFRLRHDVSLNP